MALPKSGNEDSNVLKLENIRHKHKKSKRTTKKKSRSRIENDLQIQDNHFVANAQGLAGQEPVKLCTTSNLDAQNASDGDVINTPAKRSLVSNRRFDKVKVERIKSELANGKYQINYLRVADKFIEHERFG